MWKCMVNYTINSNNTLNLIEKKGGWSLQILVLYLVQSNRQLSLLALSRDVQDF